MKTIILRPLMHTITVKLYGDGNGEIESDLRQFVESPLPQDNGEGTHIFLGRMEEYYEEEQNCIIWNEKIDVLESIVLAHACAGVDIEQPEYFKGLEVTLEKLENME